jgi:hypothetical protein
MSKFEVYAGQGQGGASCEEYDTLEEAKKCVRDHKGEASFAIYQPDGTWYQWVHTTDDRVRELIEWADKQPPGAFED